jgi:phosphohistidine phosphatase
VKSLTLLRHAKSDWADPAMTDFERPLNARGKSAARMIGTCLRESGASFDLVLCSPAARAVETLERVAETYGPGLRPRHDERIYLASPSTLLELVRAVPDDVARLLIVGHNPGMEQLSLLLSAESDQRARVQDKFPTGGLVEIDFASDRWAEVDEGSGTIRRFIVPRELGV